MTTPAVEALDDQLDFEFSDLSYPYRYALVYNGYSTDPDGKNIQKIPLENVRQHFGGFRSSGAMPATLAATDFGKAYHNLAGDNTLAINTSVLKPGYRSYIYVHSGSVTLNVTIDGSDIWTGPRYASAGSIIEIFDVGSNAKYCVVRAANDSWELMTETILATFTTISTLHNRKIIISSMTGNKSMNLATGLRAGFVCEFLNLDASYNLTFSANGATVTYNRPNTTVGYGESARILYHASGACHIQISGVENYKTKGTLDSGQRTYSGTSDTAVLADTGKVVKSNNASANTHTIPPQVDVAWADDSHYDVLQYGAGQTTITAGAGVTLRYPSAQGPKTSEQYGVVTLLRLASNEWLLIGGVA